MGEQKENFLNEDFSKISHIEISLAELLFFFFSSHIRPSLPLTPSPTLNSGSIRWASIHYYLCIVICSVQPNLEHKYKFFHVYQYTGQGLWGLSSPANNKYHDLFLCITAMFIACPSFWKEFFLLEVGMEYTAIGNHLLCELSLSNLYSIIIWWYYVMVPVVCRELSTQPYYTTYRRGV